MNDTEIYQRAMDQWGWGTQVDMVQEEVGELLTSLARYNRGRDDATDVMEEIADVEIMLGQLRTCFPNNDVDELKAQKLERLERRLEES